MLERVRHKITDHEKQMLQERSFIVLKQSGAVDILTSMVQRFKEEHGDERAMIRFHDQTKKPDIAEIEFRCNNDSEDYYRPGTDPDYKPVLVTKGVKVTANANGLVDVSYIDISPGDVRWRNIENDRRYQKYKEENIPLDQKIFMALTWSHRGEHPSPIES